MAHVGLAGLSMRAVASQAQIQLGALSYYFNDKSDLIAQAFQQLSDREIERVVQTAERLQPTMTADELAALVADMIIEGSRRHKARSSPDTNWSPKPAATNGCARCSKRGTRRWCRH